MSSRGRRSSHGNALIEGPRLSGAQVKLLRSALRGVLTKNMSSPHEYRDGLRLNYVASLQSVNILMERGLLQRELGPLNPAGRRCVLITMAGVDFLARLDAEYDRSEA